MARKTSAKKLTSSPTMIQAPLADRMMIQTSLRFAFHRKRARKTTVRSVTEVICRMRRTLLSVLPYRPAMLSIYTHPIFYKHDTGIGHPESSARIDAAMEGVDRAGF